MEEFIWVYVLFAVIMLIIRILVSRKFTAIAFQKGYDEEVHAFAMCFWLGLVGYLYIIALPDLTVQHNYKEERIETPAQSGDEEETTKTQAYQCPTCKETIIYGIKKCPFCNQKFDWDISLL